jgi:hypothetical protein
MIGIMSLTKYAVSGLQLDEGRGMPPPVLPLPEFGFKISCRQAYCANTIAAKKIRVYKNLFFIHTLSLV